uniref:Uncharacterized protein n=1 Tax=Avena sativa TaxID=4498 RepID=A0ACD5V743_AVESA
MSCIKDVPTLRGDNYSECRKKVDLAFICAEVDWVLETKPPPKPTEPVREAADDDAAWEKKQRDYAPLEMSYTLENRKWQIAKKKCMAFIKNTIEQAIVGSIVECISVAKYLEKIKSQFSGSSKTYATQLLQQLVTKKYHDGGHGIREHILWMSNMAAKLKHMDADLELKLALLVHLVMASLLQQFDNFVVNYNMAREKCHEIWNGIEKSAVSSSSRMKPDVQVMDVILVACILIGMVYTKEACEVVKGAVIGLNQLLGPISWNCGRENSEDPKHVPMYAAECQEDVFYEEPDLSGGVEGVDYEILYCVDDNESN